MQTHPQTQGQNGPQRTAGHRWPCQESRQTTPRPPLLPPAGHAILACPASEGQTDGERETPGHANPNQPNPANIQPRHTGVTENKRTNSQREKGETDDTKWCRPDMQTKPTRGPRYTGVTGNKRATSPSLGKKPTDDTKRRPQICKPAPPFPSHQMATLYWRDQKQKGNKPKPRQRSRHTPQNGARYRQWQEICARQTVRGHSDSDRSIYSQPNEGTSSRRPP